VFRDGESKSLLVAIIIFIALMFGFSLSGESAKANETKSSAVFAGETIDYPEELRVRLPYLCYQLKVLQAQYELLYFVASKETIVAFSGEDIREAKTHLAELVQRYPNHVQAYNASARNLKRVAPDIASEWSELPRTTFPSPAELPC
jgi:hypothetical protein